MATWTDIPDEVLEPGKHIRSVDAFALRNNPIAIAQGAPGAPKVEAAALARATAGSAYTLFQMNGTYTYTHVANTPPDVWSLVPNMGGHIPLTVLSNGVIRISLQHRGNGTPTTNGVSVVRVLLNGAMVKSWTSPRNAVFQDVSVDVSVNIGDALRIQAYATNNVAASGIARWRNIKISSGTPCLGVA